MADKRMFSLKIVDSDLFLDMPLSSQCLYFHLSMRADDDGFVDNPKKIIKIIGANDDDLKILITKGFVIVFERGIIVITHWKINNFIRKDRYKPTMYIEQKQQLYQTENGAYISEEKVGKKLATEMEIYVTGSLNVFNHQSNVDLNKQLLCFDIKELGSQLKKIGMLVIQDQVWNKVSQNRGNKATRYYIDEFHLLLKDEQTASYSVEIWKRFRKWGGIPTGITQNVKDLLMSKEIENIFDNTDFVLMLNQASGDREILARKLKISQPQLRYVTNSNAGEGLLFFGNTIVPFLDKFPKDTILYQKMTTKPEEVR